jgi:hypothetical protein
MSRQQIVQDGTRHAAGRGAAHGLERRPIVAFGVLVGLTIRRCTSGQASRSGWCWLSGSLARSSLP